MNILQSFHFLISGLSESSPPEDDAGLLPPLSILEQPSDTTVIEDEPVTLICKAAFVQLEPQHYSYFSSVKNEPKISIQWFHNAKLGKLKFFLRFIVRSLIDGSHAIAVSTVV